MGKDKKSSSEYFSNYGLLEKLEKLKRKESLKGKAVCFIPQWEASHLDGLIEPNDKKVPYILKEKVLLQMAKGSFDLMGCLSFIVYQKEENDKIKFSIYDKAEEILSKGEKFNSDYFIMALCIDYDKFDSSVLYEFFNYTLLVEDSKKVDILDSFGELFRFVSRNVRWLSFGKIRLIVNKYFENKSLDSRDWSEIDFLANSSFEFVENSLAWQGMGEDGYLWSGNFEKNKINNFSVKAENVRFFYSFESLLFYELKELFLKPERCRHCGKVLPERYKGKYCPNNKKCSKERGKIRQRKFKEGSKK